MSLELDSNSYYQAIAKRLSEDGYDVETKTKADNHDLDILAFKGSWELTKVGKITRFVLGTSMADLTIESIKTYSKSMIDYVLRTWKKERSTGFVSKSILCVPLIATTNINDEIKAWLAERSFEKYWLAFEFPVVFSMVDSQLCYSLKTPIWGRLYYKGFRKFVEATLRAN